MFNNLREVVKIDGSHFKPVTNVLSVGASVYTSILIIRDILYHWHIISEKRLPVPVISLGNLTCGGTGKTPAVVWMVRKLQKLGSISHKPVILSRGYGGDESLLLSKLLPGIPHFMNPKRVSGGKEAIASLGKNIVLILDDGFQHRRLARDLDFLLIDATSPFGYGYILPRGFLREEPRAASRAHAVIITRSDQIEKTALNALRQRLHRLCSKGIIAEAIHRPLYFHDYKNGEIFDLNAIKSHRVAFFSAIGNPESFSHTLRDLGAQVSFEMDFADHHKYSLSQQAEIVKKADLSGADVLVTTAKDAVKLNSCIEHSIPIWVLDIDFEITRGEDQLTELLINKLKLYGS